MSINDHVTDASCALLIVFRLRHPFQVYPTALLTMTEKHSVGIHAWMLSIRQSMTNDPCRQLFEDQVQTHAFLFLDDYLENIIAGPQQAYVLLFSEFPLTDESIVQ